MSGPWTEDPYRRHTDSGVPAPRSGPGSDDVVAGDRVTDNPGQSAPWLGSVQGPAGAATGVDEPGDE